MLGLDGSFVFLEHVFWVVSLNTLFILLFAYFPHQMGKVFVKRNAQKIYWNFNSLNLTWSEPLNFQSVKSIYMETKNLHFEGAINTIIGKWSPSVRPNFGLSLNDLKWFFWRILHVWFNVYGLACGIVFDEYGENESACKIALYLHQGRDIYAFWIIYNAITMRLLDWRLFTFTIGEFNVL